MASLNVFHDGRDALDQTSSSITSEPHNCSIASTSSSTSANSESMSELSDSDTESYKCDQMETDSSAYSPISHDEMEAEFDSNENEQPESQSSLNNDSSTNQYEPMEYYSSHSNSDSASDDMEDDNTSFEDELGLEEYFQNVESNEEILKSYVRSVIYVDVLEALVAYVQENDSPN